MADLNQILDSLNNDLTDLMNDAVMRERNRVFHIAIKHMPHIGDCWASYGDGRCTCDRPKQIDKMLAEIVATDD